MKDFDKAEAAGVSAKMGSRATDEDIQDVASKMDLMKKGPLAKIWDKVVQLWDAFKSPDTPKAVKTIIIGGLIYMVSPIDLIPDFIPVVGLLDDASVIGIVFSQFVRLAGCATVGAVIATLIDKNEIKKRAKEILEDPKVKENLKQMIIEHDKGFSMKDLESWDRNDGIVDFTAKVTAKTNTNVSIDILDSWDNIIVSDIEIKGKKVADDINVGTEILLTA